MIKAGYSTPMLHVASIERSIEFYERLGFETIDTDRCEPLGWARIHCEGGALMFLRAEHDHDHDHGHEHGHGHAHEHESAGGTEHSHTHPELLLVMYTEDLAGLREQLIGQGVEVSEIRHPDYMPSGEMGVPDPDGNLVLINHWGRQEHDAWLERIGRKPEG